ncbi:ATP-binding protein [Fibrobacter succinogenes]|uniref:ATP-binding protein n=1 Tax=Fibrobacter succinogenes TaxID=833 RepID=UPI0026F2F957|nr:ATP-binding protein [Fibrobacter succinogenes]
METEKFMAKPTIVSMAAPDYAQELTFEKLFMYYGAKGVALRKETFKKSLRLLTADGRYNIMALLLSDANDIPIRVSVFCGKSKADTLFSVKEYGNSCILYAMDKILEYGDAINIIQADERGRISERKDVPLFDYEAFHEAILNAFIHNKWLGMNAPMISVFTDRIEILSHGGLGLEQDLEGFYKGVSIPVNEILASIFLQLRLSERSGRGVPKIVEAYGRDSIKIQKNFIVVTIPFNRINVTPFELNEGQPTVIPTAKATINATINATIKLTDSQKKILEIILSNPRINQAEIAEQLNLHRVSVAKSMSKLQKEGVLKRVGSNKNGYWEIVEK